MLSEAYLASRSETSRAGSRVLAAEVSVVLYVELEPETLDGVEFGLDEKAPPEREDSAARESDAMGPDDSVLVLRASGSVVFWKSVRQVVVVKDKWLGTNLYPLVGRTDGSTLKIHGRMCRFPLDQCDIWLCSGL